MYTRVAFLSLLAAFFISSSACLAAPPVLAVSPTYMEFTANEGGANPDPNILSIWRDGGNGPLNWTVTEDCNWLTVDPNSGKSQGEVDDCNVIVDITGLTGGLYNCQLTVDAGTAANSPQIVDVNLTVIGPEIGLSATYFEFTATEGGANPNDQILTITNTGGGTLNWQVAEDCSWLSAEPNSGSSTGEADDANLSVDITALAGGIYNCQLTVSDPNASNSPQIVDVNLLVYTDINLVGWWKFDEGSGSTAIDSSGRGNDGTLQNGPIWTTGQIDGALDFDGSNDYVGVADDSSLDISGAITLSAWVKLDDNTNDQQITGKTESGGGYSGGGYRLIFLTGTGFSDGTFRLAFLKTNGIGGTGSGNYGTNTNWDRVVSEKNDWQTDTWYHVAATWDGTTSSESMKMYVDGAPDANHTANQATIKTNNNALQIGRTLYTSPASQFDGIIDDVRVYNRALSAGEIQQLCAKGHGGRAFNPNPDDGQTQVDPNVVLSWSPGAWASDVNGHDVYFGTDYNDVNDATTASAEYIGRQDANSYNPGGLNQGTNYYWRIDEVNDPDLWKGDVWSFTTGTPLIEISSSYFQFTAFEDGANPVDQVLTITNSGFGTLNWQIAEDCNWLSAEPNSGSSTGEADDANLSVDITSLTGGIYNCQLMVSDGNAENSPQIVDVDLTVIGPEIGLSATYFEFTAIEGDANPDDQILTITNTGAGTLNWQITEDCNWLTADPNSGSSTGEADDVNLSVDIFALTGGIYNCQLTVSDSNASNSPQIIDVDLTVIGPEIQLSATQFEFTAIEGGANPNDQILTITNTGGGTLNWQIAEDCNWLSAEPNSGSSTGEADDANLSVDIASLTSGIYNCQLTVSDSNASNSPQIVGVNLYVGDSDGLLYVPSEYSTIQEAIDVALDGDTVIVAEGTYTGSGNRNLDFGGKAITVQSTDPEDPCVVASTVIDCGNVSGRRGFYFHSGEGPNSIVSGLKIARGRITGSPAEGGGIYCSGASPTIENCIITKNISRGNHGSNGGDGKSAYGGGIYCESASNPRIINCIISKNTAEGGDGDLPAGNGGSARGGGTYGPVTISNCTISDNNAVGGECAFGGPPCGKADGGGLCGRVTISNSIISGNYLYGSYTDGAGMYCHDNSSVTNCIVINNSLGGMPSYYYGIRTGSNTSIRNCTIYNHLPPIAAAVGAAASSTITNCIIWSNAGNDVAGSPTVTYSCTEQVISGTGNINSDPCFVSGPWGDYYLSQTAAGQAVDSPCVDAGSDTAANLSLNAYTTRTDYWPDRGIVDMGYHYPLTTDIDKNWHVDLIDFSILGFDWLICIDPCDSNGLEGDITEDNCVDINDLGILVYCWLDCYVTKAFAPKPSDNQASVDPNVILSWMAGGGALNHDVYFGTDYNDVNDATTASAEYMGRQVANSWDVNNYDVNGLDYDTSHYWRIDEVGPACTKEGDVWSFTTGGLVSLWKFDEGSGSTAYDSEGNNDGTVNGATWTTGQIDGALDFDGSGDYVDIADSASLSFTYPGLTIAAWVYLNQDQSGERSIVRKNNQWELGIFPADNKIRNLVWTDGTNGWTAANDESYTINTDTWYFFAFTYNGSVLKHYANGAQVGSDKTVTGNIVDNSNNVGIASNTGGGSNNVNGKIDDVRIYDRALSAGEIWQLYQDGLP